MKKNYAGLHVKYSKKHAGLHVKYSKRRMQDYM
jgi:hypothetical protein